MDESRPERIRLRYSIDTAHAHPGLERALTGSEIRRDERRRFRQDPGGGAAGDPGPQARRPGAGRRLGRGHTTDELIELAKEITENPPAREMDMLLSTGEQVSVALMAMAIEQPGRPGDQLHRRPDRARDRQLSHQGPDQKHLDRADGPGARRRQDRDRRRLSGGRRALQHHDARPRRLGHDGRGAGGRARGRRPARSTPTSTASTRPTRGSCPRRARSTGSATTRCSSWPAWGPA